jgi:hypothetical protein
MWLQSQLLLQSSDGRADGNPDDVDTLVSGKLVYSDGRPTSLTYTAYFVFPPLFSILSRSNGYRYCARMLVGHIRNKRPGVRKSLFFAPLKNAPKLLGSLGLGLGL